MRDLPPDEAARNWRRDRRRRIVRDGGANGSYPTPAEIAYRIGAAMAVALCVALGASLLANGSAIDRAQSAENLVTQTESQSEEASKPPCLFIGQDRRGCWVVQDARGLCGGLFANRTEAIRFAMFECRRRPQSVVMTPDGLELDVTVDVETPRLLIARRVA